MFKFIKVMYRRWKFAFYNLRHFGVFSSREERLIAYGLARAMANPGMPFPLPDTLVVFVDADDVCYLTWRRELAMHPELGHLANEIGGTLSVIKQRRNTPQWEQEQNGQPGRPSAQQAPWAPWMVPAPQQDAKMTFFDQTGNRDCQN